MLEAVHQHLVTRRRGCREAEGRVAEARPAKRASGGAAQLEAFRSGAVQTRLAKFCSQSAAGLTSPAPPAPTRPKTAPFNGKVAHLAEHSVLVPDSVAPGAGAQQRGSKRGEQSATRHAALLPLLRCRALAFRTPRCRRVCALCATSRCALLTRQAG